MHAGRRDQRRARLGGPVAAVQVGDDAARRPHQCDTGRVIPDMRTETDCAAEDSGRGVGEVDAVAPCIRIREHFRLRFSITASR